MRAQLLTGVASALGLVVLLTPRVDADSARERSSPSSTDPLTGQGGGGSGAVSQGYSSIAGAIDALVVQSWSECDSDLVVWQSINDTWTELGSTPVNINFDLLPVCKGKLRYDDLVTSGAEVLILSDVAGGDEKLGKLEKKAIERYVQEGHGLVSTFMTFRRDEVLNRSLAPLLGIDTNFARFSKFLPETVVYVPSHLQNPLFARVPIPYVISDYLYAQVPKDETWDLADLAPTASYVARSAEGAGAIVLNEATTYRSVYISTMPEWQGGADDKQFIYNAITYAGGKVATPPDGLSPTS